MQHVCSNWHIYFVLVESNTIELSVEFSDIKGLKTRYFYDLITEESLDRLSNDVSFISYEREQRKLWLELGYVPVTSELKACSDLLGSHP